MLKLSSGEKRRRISANSSIAARPEPVSQGSATELVAQRRSVGAQAVAADGVAPEHRRHGREQPHVGDGVQHVQDLEHDARQRRGGVPEAETERQAGRDSGLSGAMQSHAGSRARNHHDQQGDDDGAGVQTARSVLGRSLCWPHDVLDRRTRPRRADGRCGPDLRDGSGRDLPLGTRGRRRGRDPGLQPGGIRPAAARPAGGRRVAGRRARCAGGRRREARSTAGGGAGRRRRHRSVHGVRHDPVRRATSRATVSAARPT